MLLPFIGESGTFTLATPFSNTVDTGARYTCQAIRSIADYLAENVDVFTDYYQSAGLTQADYDDDFKNSVSIVTLQSNAGHWVYVPASYILRYPNSNGVQYANKILAFSLPGVPVDGQYATLYTDLATDIKELIKSRLGVVPSVKVENVSRINLITLVDHQTKQDARNAVKSVASTLYGQIKSLESQVASLNSQVSELTAYIETHQ